MDEYVVGSIADLIAGNLTPSRPASLKRPLTPKKHEPSPRVTPRSEALSGREALLSPTMQRKKAVAKKSPKRIFEKEDLNITAVEITSPKADKVKKHLQAELDSSKNNNSSNVDITLEDVGGTPNKRKKKRNHEDSENQTAQKRKHVQQHSAAGIENEENGAGSMENTNVKESIVGHEENNGKKKRNKKNKNKQSTPKEAMDTKSDLSNDCIKEMKESKKKHRKNKKNKIIPEGENENDQENLVRLGGDAKKLLEVKKKKKKNKKKQNITNEPIDNGDKSDSEHESDNDIDSETEQGVKQILDDGPIEGDTSDEEAEMKQIKILKKKKKNMQNQEVNKLKDEPGIANAAEDDKNRTLFVGNVPLSKKTKKEIKQIFIKYGLIETIRIRAVPVKDMKTTPKVAAIKSDIHPDRTSVNVYVKFADKESVTKALVENNRVLSNHHLRVKRSDTAETHDPRRALFVGNIPLGIEDEVLRAAFEKCGEIESVRIVRDKTTQIGKGFGYVNFASSDGVELALGLSEEDLTIKNRILRIRRYTQAPPGQKVKTKPQLQTRLPNKGPGQNRGPHQSRGPQNRGPPSSRDHSNFRGQNEGYDSRNRFGPNKFQGRNNSFPGNRGQSFQRDGKPKDDSGALRRIKKRKSEDNHGPPEKRARDADQPIKGKKQKKEFVGMTAEKKKKKKFDKGRKQKQMLSEILTK